MNTITSYPSVSLNTANVYTETARRDNQLRELVTPAKQVEASAKEPRLASEQDKTKQPGSSQLSNQDALSNNTSENKKIEEKAEQEEKQQQQQQKQKEEQLAQQEQKALQELKDRDAEVRAHEQAHASVGGQYAGSPTYEFERGSDGNNYAVAGEVPIDISKVPNDPEKTITKMQQVRAAALAPQEPSGADKSIAAQANKIITEARSELASQNSEEQSGESNSLTARLNRNLAERDDEVNQRSVRIANFYQAATSPNEQPNLARYA